MSMQCSLTLENYCIVAKHNVLYKLLQTNVKVQRWPLLQQYKPWYRFHITFHWIATV